MSCAALAGHAAAEGRPLFYWGARAPIISAPAGAPRGARLAAGASHEARVLEVHAAYDAGLVLRFTLDRPVAAASRLADGTPVSGRLRAVLYLDGDGDPSTGWRAGGDDPRTGAESRLEVGVLTLGEDPEEKIAARAVITATLHALARDGRRRVVWRGDEAATPDLVSARGEWLEVRLARGTWSGSPGRARVALADGGQVLEGRLPAP